MNELSLDFNCNTLKDEHKPVCWYS